MGASPYVRNQGRKQQKKIDVGHRNANKGKKIIVISKNTFIVDDKLFVLHCLEFYVQKNNKALQSKNMRGRIT